MIVSTNYHELAHFGQMAHTNRPCMFNHNNAAKNIKAYGQPVAPCYKLDQVKLKYMSIYGSNEDRFVSPIDVNKTRAQLGGELSSGILQHLAIAVLSQLKSTSGRSNPTSTQSTPSRFSAEQADNDWRREHSLQSRGPNPARPSRPAHHCAIFARLQTSRGGR
jgi:hypothetical protein